MNVPENLSASWQVIALIAGSLILLGVGVYMLIRIKRKPKDKEKRRRLAVNLSGRLGDASITEVQDGVIFYEYSVRGVTYTASQDVSQLREHIPTELERLIGPATMKYSTNNPANSIILCEEWSGLRTSPPRTFERRQA